MVAPSRFYNEPPHVVRKTITFTGAANLGAIGAVPLFTVTGEVMVAFLVPYCTVLLAGATATLSLGVTGGVADFVAVTTATEIDADEFWTSTTPAANSIALPAALKEILITDDIIGDVLTAAITAGAIELTCYWWPLSTDGKVEAA